MTTAISHEEAVRDLLQGKPVTLYGRPTRLHPKTNRPQILDCVDSVFPGRRDGPFWRDLEDEELWT